MIDLNETRKIPLYESVYRQLRAEIGGGQRKPGEKLPSKRALAAALGISINTVETAYRQLESEGFIEARDRSGFYVLPLSDLGPDTAPEPRHGRPQPPPAPEIDFAVGAVDEGLFPFTVWQRLTRLSLGMPGILARGDSLGDPGLREEIARYLARARGVRCDPEQILLGPGTDALLRTLGSLLPESCTFVVENPAYHRAYAHFSRMGHRVVPAQMDDRGVTVGPLRALDSAVVYTAPSHQYPLGFAMPMGRRTALLAWCAEGGFRYVVEDDYDSEFRYDARPLPSLQSIDRAERVIYLGTMSGVIAPSLRISYMILPAALLRRLRERRDPYSCNIPTLEQFTLREFMRQGYFEKHLNRMRVCYRSRRRELCELLRPYEGRLRAIGAQAGSYLLVRVDNGMDEEQLCAAALRTGVRVWPISPYFMGGVPEQYRSCVLLGYGNLTQGQMRRGTELLAKAWALDGP